MVYAINEVFQCASENIQKIVNSLTGIGMIISSTDDAPSIGDILTSIPNYVVFAIGTTMYLYVLNDIENLVTEDALLLTGGFENEFTGGNTTHSSTLTATYLSSNKIDFTNIKSITFNITSGGGSSGGGTTKITAGLHDGNSFIDEYSTAISRTANSVSSQSLIYDTSELTGEYYLGFYYWLQAYRYARVNSITINL